MNLNYRSQTESFKRGFYEGLNGTPELSAREIGERFPGEHIESFAQGIIDGNKRDWFRFDLIAAVESSQQAQDFLA